MGYIIVFDILFCIIYVVTTEVDEWERKLSELKKEISSQRSSAWEVSPYKRANLHSGRVHDEDITLSVWEYGDRPPQVTYVEHTLTRTVEYESITTGGSSEFPTTSKTVPWYRKNRMARSPVTRESFRTGLELLSESQGKDL